MTTSEVASRSCVSSMSLHRNCQTSCCRAVWFGGWHFDVSLVVGSEFYWGASCLRSHSGVSQRACSADQPHLFWHGLIIWCCPSQQMVSDLSVPEVLPPALHAAAVGHGEPGAYWNAERQRSASVAQHANLFPKHSRQSCPSGEPRLLLQPPLI